MVVSGIIYGMISEQNSILDKLEQKVSHLNNENASLSNKNTSLHNEVTFLKEQLEWFRRQVFGQKSEKIIAKPNGNQLFFDGFDKVDAPQEETQTIRTHKRKKAKRNGQDSIQIPDDLPVERIVLDIPEDEKICKETGKPLVKIGEAISRKLAHRPGSFYIKEIVRPKYALPKGSKEGILCADLPDSILFRCLADESLLSEILVRKFADHAPLYRTEEIFGREGIKITRQLLSQWVVKVGIALEPLYIAMNKAILENDCLYIDESPVSLLKPGKGKTQKAYMWVMAGGASADPPYRIYSFQKDRRHCHAEELLADYQGVFHSDKYGAYEALSKKQGLIWCPC